MQNGWKAPVFYVTLKNQVKFYWWNLATLLVALSPSKKVDFNVMH